MFAPDRLTHPMDHDVTSVKSPLVWALLDDRAGNRSQCLGVAEALGLEYRVKEVRYSPLAHLPNMMLGKSFLGLSMESRLGFKPPWPDLIIAAGRRTAPVARAIKARNGGRSKLIQIMHPGNSGLSDFDLVAVPSHDSPVSGRNVLTILGAPHGITPTLLSDAASEWGGKVAGLPAPRIAVLVGGSTRRRTFTTEMGRKLGVLANNMAHAAGGSLLISTSRRTGAGPEEAMLSQIGVPHAIFRWGQEGPNPYRGYLALADAIVVTGDSVSMCSEVCATEAPVYIYAPPGLITDKHARLHDQLYEQGYARPLSSEWSSWTHRRLNSALEIAEYTRSHVLD